MNHGATSGLACWKGTLSVWHAVRVWSVSIWTRQSTLAPAFLLPPQLLPRLSYYRGCTMLSGSPDFCWTSEKTENIEMELLSDCGGRKNYYNHCWHHKDYSLPKVYKIQTERICLLYQKAKKLSMWTEYEHNSSPPFFFTTFVVASARQICFISF